MTTYVISATGNNNNSGTVNSPKAITWLSFLQPGDVAQLRGDVYTTKVQLSGLIGTASNPIIIQPYGGETPIINGGWDSSQHPLDKAATIDVYQYRALFELNDSRYTDVYGIKVINSNGQAYGINGSRHCNFDSIAAEDIYGMTFSCVGDGPDTLSNQYITLNSGNFYNVCVAHKWWHTYVGPNNTYVRLIPSSVFFGRGTENCTITNTRLERCGAEGLVAGRGSRYITFDNCIAVDGRHACFYVATTQYSTLKNCVAYFTAAGYAAISGMRGEGYTLRDEEPSFEQGYGNYQSRDITFENCIAIDCQLGFTGFGQASMVNFTMRNCTAINCINGILNRSASSSRPTPSGNVYENNIFANFKPYTSSIFYDRAAAQGNLGNKVATSTGTTYRYNLWYDVEGSARPANGAGTGDVLANPLLENANFPLNNVTAVAFRANNYATAYQPTEFSPAVNASGGTATTTDLLGRAAVGTRDIGAMEYAASSGGGGGGALTHGTTTEYNQASGSTATFPHNHDGDTLIVICHGMRYQTGTLPFTFLSAAYNGESLTLMDTQQGTTTNRDYTTAVFYGQPASSGSNDIVVNASRVVNRWNLVAISVTGADATAAATISKGTSAGPWSASTTLDQGNDIWFAITARADSTAVVGTGTEEYETVYQSGGLDTDMRAAAVWANYPDGGSQTLTVSTGPQSTRGPTWIFFEIIAAALYDVSLLMSAAEATTAAGGPTVSFSAVQVLPGAAEISTAAKAPIVGVTGPAAITVSPGTANAVTGATDPTNLGDITLLPGAADVITSASCDVSIFTIVLARLFVLQERRRVFTLPELRDR